MNDPRLEIILAAKDVTGKAFASVNSQVANLTKSVFSLNGALVTVAGASAMGLMVQRSLEVTAELKRNADMAGVTIEAYQELDYVAKKHQITVDAMTDGLKELSLRTDEFVVTGAGPAKEAFERLGYNQEQLNNMLSDTPALLQDVIWRMEGLGQAAKIRIADELFGGSGGEQFVAMINAGARSFEAFRKEAHELGLVLDADVVNNSAEAKKKVDALTKVLSVNFQGVVAQLAPDISDIADSMAKWVKENQALLSQDVPGYVKNFTSKINEFVNSKNFERMVSFLDLMTKGGVLRGGNLTVFGFLDGLKPDPSIAEQYANVRKEIAALNKEMESGGVFQQYNQNRLSALQDRAAELRHKLYGQPDRVYPSGATLSGGSADGSGVNYGPLPAIDYKKDYLTDHEKRKQQSQDEILAASGDVIRALEQMKRDSLQRQADLKRQFQDEHDRIMMSSFDLERKYLAEQVARWEKQGHDRLMIKEAESKKLAEIADREMADLEARTKDALDGFFNEIESQEAAVTNTMVDHLKSLEAAARGVFKGMEDAAMDFLFTGEKSISKFVTAALKDLGRLAWQETITKPLTGWFGGLFSSAHGNVVSGISAYSNQIVSSPTIVPGASRITAYATGGALFGEAGPEGILPLKRMPSGNLGVEASGGRSIVMNNTFNIESSGGDDQSLVSQIVTQLEYKVRSIISDEKRVGGSLNPIS